MDADRRKSTEHLRDNAAIIFIVVVTVALCSIIMAGRINVVFAQGNVQIEDTSSSQAAEIVEGPVSGGTPIAGMMPETSTVTAGAVNAHVNALSVAVIVTKNSMSEGSLGYEGGAGIEASLHVGELETTDGVDVRTLEVSSEKQVGYITARSVNVRALPSTSSEILENKGYGEEVTYATTNVDGWYAVLLNGGKYGYISSDFIADEITAGSATSYACSGDTRKLYMSYRCIGAGRQLSLQQNAETASNGVRVYGGRYMIAIGQSYGAEVGTPLDVVLSDGTVIPCIVGDAKNDLETQGCAGYIGIHGDVTEWIVDPNALPDDVTMSGDVSSIDGWGANVEELRIYREKSVF